MFGYVICRAAFNKINVKCNCVKNNIISAFPPPSAMAIVRTLEEVAGHAVTGSTRVFLLTPDAETKPDPSKYCPAKAQEACFFVGDFELDFDHFCASLRILDIRWAQFHGGHADSHGTTE